MRMITSTFYKKVLIISSGIASGQVILFLISPLIARIFSPADFALFSIYTFAIASFSILASF